MQSCRQIKCRCELTGLSLLPLPFWDSTLHGPPASVAECPPPADISPCHPAGRSGRLHSPGAAALHALLTEEELASTNKTLTTVDV